MEEKRLTVYEQAVEAARIVNELFEKAVPPVPEGATVHSLWIELCKLKGKTKKPKKVTAIQLLLEDPRLVGLPIPLIADIIKKVFTRAGIACDTSDSSIRWYISQKTLEWKIQPRDKKSDHIDY